MKCNFAHSVLEQSRQYADKTAFIDGYESVTYAELSTRTRRFGRYLLDKGLVSGDRVIISMEDCVDWPVVFLACLHTGIVPLPLSTVIGQDLFWQIAEFIECKHIIAGDDMANKIQRPFPLTRRHQVKESYELFDDTLEPVMVHPDSEAWLNISSGSTGMPKVAVHRHQNLYEILELSPRVSYGMDSNSIIMSIAKMSWNFGLHNSLTYTLGLGATAIVIPEAPAAQIIFEYANKYNPTIVVTSPSIIKRLLSPTVSKYSWPKSIKHFHSSGEHLSAPMYDQFFERFGLRLNSCIGMMETSTNYCANPDWEHDRGTVGKPLPGCKVKLLDDQGLECKPGQVGEIYASSPATAIYYLKNYAKTKETFVGEWVRTGDLGFWNDRGNLTFVGRVDDVFKVNDLLVSPVEIESAMSKHSAVDQVTVTRVQNSQGINELHAFVMPKENFDMDDFRNYLQKNLFAHQVPKKIHLVDALSETITNKKDRRTLAKNVATF